MKLYKHADCYFLLLLLFLSCLFLTLIVLKTPVVTFKEVPNTEQLKSEIYETVDLIKTTWNNRISDLISKDEALEISNHIQVLTFNIGFQYDETDMANKPMVAQLRQTSSEMLMIVEKIDLNALKLDPITIEEIKSWIRLINTLFLKTSMLGEILGC